MHSNFYLTKINKIAIGAPPLNSFQGGGSFDQRRAFPSHLNRQEVLLLNFFKHRTVACSSQPDPLLVCLRIGPLLDNLPLEL